MQTIALKDNDLEFRNGDFVMTDDDMVQAAEIILQSGKNEWFFNEELGINYLNILGKSSNDTIRNEIVTGLALEPRIRILEEVDIVKANRSARVSFRALTTEKEEVSGEVGIDVG